MNDLVNMNPLAMSSLEIAKLTGKRHDNVVRDLKELEEQGVITLLKFEERKGYGNNNYRTVYMLPKRECLILISGYSSILRTKIIDRWLELEAKLLEKENKAKIRSEARLEYGPMTDAVKLEESRDNREAKWYHYSNEADLINKIALGMTAKRFKEYHKIEGSLRDNLTKRQLDCILDLQRANTVYLRMGWDLDRRKNELKKLFYRNHHEVLIDEIHQITQ